MDPICRKAHLEDDSVKKVLILLNFGLDIMGRVCTASRRRQEAESSVKSGL
jgi:hypothetical protein